MIKRYLGPILVVLAGLFLAVVIFATGPRPDRQVRQSGLPAVKVIPASPGPVRMSITAHGAVIPGTESDLVSEVSGRVIAVSPSMVSGGFFSKGDVLVEIEQVDYRTALEQARARLASAESELSNAEKDHKRQRELGESQAVSESQMDEAANRLEFARASARAARAMLTQAGRDLERTRLTAPYDGRVRSERVDAGQFVARGEALASLYSTDFAEVRLPVRDQDLAYLPLSLTGTANEADAAPEAILRARFLGAPREWTAKVVRTEGELDPLTRVVNLIAQVERPYEPEPGAPPLTVGLFVEAEIFGREIDAVQVVPRSALQADNRICVVQTDGRLSFRDVEVLRMTGETVYVRGNIRDGELICVSVPDNAMEGQQVNPAAGGDAPRSP